MSEFDSILDEVNKGLLGENLGIPMGIPTLGNELCDILPSTYYLIGAESSTGKTGFIDTIFCINPLDYIILNKDKKIKIIYFSLEIPKKRKIVKWISVRLFKKYGLIIPPKVILGKDRNIKLTENEIEKIKECRNYVDKILENVIIYDQPINPKGIYSKVLKYCTSVGKIEKHINHYSGGKTYESKTYIPDDLDETVLCICDHIGLVRELEGKNKKQTLDEFSRYMVTLRNNFNVSPVIVSQFNRDLVDIQRKKFGEIIPQHNDFKDTGNCFEDSDICLALFSPSKHAIDKYGEYDINILQNRIRFCWILKNREGDENVRIALNFLGEAGYFRKMPKWNVLTNDPILMNKAIKFLK